MAKSPILGGFSTQRSPNAADNAAVNLGVEIIETKDGNVPGFLFGMSGLDILQAIGPGPIRGVLALNDTLYVVSGNEVHSVSANGVDTLLGDITIGTGLVSMFQNTLQLMILDGVGAWIVPGGYPLTSGVNSTPSIGQLYAEGDTIELQAASGFQSVYPEVKITRIANNPVTTFGIVNGGTGYTAHTNVATTPVQPQPGIGTGLTLNTTAAGAITAAAVNVGGASFAVGDTGSIAGGDGNGVYQVTAQSGGVVTAVRLLNRGAAYATATGVATTAGNANLSINTGLGFTVNTTVAAGAITAAAINNPGTGFKVGNAGLISGGGNNATYLVNAVGPAGAVTGFTIVRGGAISDPTISFTQRSTSGSGIGFVLTSPVFGAFVGLVPIDMPFSNPVKGVVSDGFGVAVFLNNQRIAASEELDLSTWRALSFGVADQSPDNCVGIELLHDEVYLFKERNSEVWVDQGLPNFPFAPLQGVHIEYGTVATFSSAKVGENVIWLSRNDQGQGIFVEAAGYKPRPISSQALTNEIQKYGDIGDCIAYARQEGGHELYVATFPSANVTWCYDQTASAMAGAPIWTQLSSGPQLDNGAFPRHWGNCFTPYRLSGQPSTVISTYQPKSVEFSTPTTAMATAGRPVGLPSSFSSALFSIWLDMPDADPHGMFFSNQTDDTLGATNPGLQIQIRNDTEGAPQISIHAFDASNAIIVSADYDFATWGAWVNLLVSIDTATQKIQVYANTIIAGVLVEQLLTGLASWFSTNPIAPSASQPWHVVAG